MIRSFKHKGLERFFRLGSTAGIQARHAGRLRMQLIALHTATAVADMDLPGYRLHRLRGSRGATWSIAVSGNWRLTFEFREGDAFLLNYEDYH